MEYNNVLKMMKNIIEQKFLSQNECLINHF